MMDTYPLLELTAVTHRLGNADYIKLLLYIAISSALRSIMHKPRFIDNIYAIIGLCSICYVPSYINFHKNVTIFQNCYL